MMDAVDQYAVFGNPIKHSRSPQIHAAFAEQTGQALHYRAHKVELGRFAEVASEFFRNGGPVWARAVKPQKPSYPIHTCSISSHVLTMHVPKKRQ